MVKDVDRIFKKNLYRNRIRKEFKNSVYTQSVRIGVLVPSDLVSNAEDRSKKATKAILSFEKFICNGYSNENAGLRKNLFTPISF